MGSEKVTLPNMGMDLPINGTTTAPYTLQYLISSLQKVDAHDHSSGKGARLSQSSIQVTSNWVMSGYGFTNTKFVGFSNPTTLTDAPNASAYFKNGDFYLKLGGGTELQVTKDNSLNTSLIGGFTGDYASSQAFCVFDEVTNTYAFNAPVTDTNTLSNVVVGALEIRSTTQDKNVYGLRFVTTGNIAGTFDWTLPVAQASNPLNVLTITDAGVIAYQDQTTLVLTSGAQSIGGIKTFANLPVLSETNAPVGSQAVNKTHLTSVISALDKTSVGLSNVDNTADSSKSVASAATLTTPRNINSVSFNGSSNITIPPGPLPSTNDGIEYVAKNGEWFPNTGGSFPEVPNDTNKYVRSYGQWDTLTLDSINDVVAPSPTAGDYLKFDGTNWIPAVVPSATSVTGEFAVGANGVTAGNVVELVSDGVQDLQNIYHCEAPTISSLVTLGGTNNVKDLALSRLTDTTVLAAWNDDTANLGQLAILTAGSPPTMSAVVATSTNDDARISISQLTSNAAAISYRTVASTNGYTQVATISSGTISLSSPSTAFRANDVPTDTCALTSSNWFVACTDGNSYVQIRTAVSNGTNAPTLGNALNVNGTNNANYLSLARTSDTTAMLVLQDASSSTGEIAHITGGTTNAPTASTLAHLDGTNNCTYITQSPIDSNHTLCAYNNATTSQGMLAVIQANGTNAPSVVSRIMFHPTLAWYNSLSAHSSNDHSLVFMDNGNDANHIVVHLDGSYNITTSQSSKFYGTNATEYHSVAALTPTTAIAAFQGANSDGFAGTLTLTPTPTINGQLLGISQDTATNGTATIDLGPVWETTNTLTLGEEYFANPAGGLTTNATPVFVGTADTTGSLVLDLRGNPAVGLEQVWEFTVPGAFTFTVPEDGEYLIEACGGGGGGGSRDAGNPVRTGGSGADYFMTIKTLNSGAVMSGTIGTGGAAGGSNANGGDGSATTFTIMGLTYTVAGGTKGLQQDAAGATLFASTWVHSNVTSFGGLGMGSSAGGSPAGMCSMTRSGPSVRGGGGVGGSSLTARPGGDGCLRITLVHGSGS